MRDGLPHSEIHGSKFVRNSPWLIAAYDVLHRLSAPRPPPNALKALDHSHCRCPPRASKGTRRNRQRKDHASSRFARSQAVKSAGSGEPPPHRAAFEQIFSSRCQIARPRHDAGGTELVYRGQLASHLDEDAWWSQTGSNRRPPACKAGALPTELWPRQGDGRRA